MFEWDEFKRRQTLEVRRLDFAIVPVLFDGRPITTTVARSEVEVRFLTVCVFDDGRSDAVVWTQRGEAKRSISFRRASDDEERAYHARYG